MKKHFGRLFSNYNWEQSECKRNFQSAKTRPTMASRLADQMQVQLVDEDVSRNAINRSSNPSNHYRRKLGNFKMTDSLVAPLGDKSQTVPNHLLNTSERIMFQLLKLWFKFKIKVYFKEIFAKLQRNQIFEVSPVEIHFSGFEIGGSKRYSQTLHVINVSDKVQRMTVLPPLSTRHFDIHYVKQVTLTL